MRGARPQFLNLLEEYLPLNRGVSGGTFLPQNYILAPGSCGGNTVSHSGNAANAKCLLQ